MHLLAAMRRRDPAPQRVLRSSVASGSGDVPPWLVNRDRSSVAGDRRNMVATAGGVAEVGSRRERYCRGKF